MAALAGGIIGYLFPSAAEAISFLGTLYLTCLKLILIPLVGLSIFLAISKSVSAGSFKKLSLNTLGFYFLSSALACLVGLVLANIFLAGLSVDSILNESFDSSTLKVATLDRFILGFLPSNIFQSLSAGNIVHVVSLSIIFSLVSAKIDSEKREFLIKTADALLDLVMAFLKYVIKLTPLGVLALIAGFASSFKASDFEKLSAFFQATTIAMIFHAALTLPLLGFFIGKFNPLQFFIQVKKALIVALSTASSSATLPVSMQCLEENAGVSKETTSFVSPLGATLNMDGSALYQALVVLLAANMSGVPLSLPEQLVAFIFVMVSSAGTAGIPGGGVMMMGMVFETLGIPLEMIGLYILVDRFWDYPVTAINVWGDLIAAKTVDMRLSSSELGQNQ